MGHQPSKVAFALSFVLLLGADARAASPPDAAAFYEHLFEQPLVTVPEAAVPAAAAPLALTLTAPATQQEATPPKPPHTGFAALVRGVGSDYKAFPLRKSTYVILGIGAAAALLAHPADDDLN